jgi:hypothetical protein
MQWKETGALNPYSTASKECLQSLQLDNKSPPEVSAALSVLSVVLIKVHATVQQNML